MKKQFAVYKVKASVEKILSVQKELSAIDKNISAEFTAHRDPQVWATAPDYWPHGDTRIDQAQKIMSAHFGTSAAASALGSIKSPKKTASSRENGKKGGRPKQWNKWYAYEDENGNTEWDDVNYDTFENWALSGQNREDVFRAVVGTAKTFCDNMIEVAQAEQRHIPYATKTDFLHHCIQLVERWNNEAIEQPWNN